MRVRDFRHAGLPLFSDLAFSLPGGWWTALLGPSGGGKSTLLRLIAGVLPGAEVEGDDGRPVAGRIAWLAQADLLLPWLSVLENVVLGFRLRGAGRDRLRLERERARALLARVGLGDVAGALPGTLSGGMRQRAALARTLVEDRPIVLMDEPFAALDAITRHRLQALAAELLEGRTVLLVTHDPREALRLGHELRVLHGFPATLAAPLRPPGPTPRDPLDPASIAMEAGLLAELAQAAAAMERLT